MSLRKLVQTGNTYKHAQSVLTSYLQFRHVSTFRWENLHFNEKRLLTALEPRNMSAIKIKIRGGTSEVASVHNTPRNSRLNWKKEGTK